MGTGPVGLDRPNPADADLGDLHGDDLVGRTEGAAGSAWASPKLEDRQDGLIPHVFRNGALCLHYRWEWNTRMDIGDTIIAWTSEWLYHYEMWHVTGEWLGGGHVATAKPNESQAA